MGARSKGADRDALSFKTLRRRYGSLAYQRAGRTIDKTSRDFERKPAQCGANHRTEHQRVIDVSVGHGRNHDIAGDSNQLRVEVLLGKKSLLGSNGAKQK